VAGFARWLAAHVGEVEVVCAANRPPFYDGGAPARLRTARAWPLAAAFVTRFYRRAAPLARRWDAVVAHWLVPSAALGLALAPRGRHLAIAHGSDLRLLARLPLGTRLVRRIAGEADLVYVARALRVAGATGRVVPMGIDLDAVTPRPGERETARRALGLDRFTFLVLGRLSREKGVDRAIAALPARAALIVAGSGPERPALQALARRAGAGEVRFVGEVHGEDKRRWLAAADALVVPSRHDGAPTAVFEAKAAGLPVVATRAGGLTEIVGHDLDGWLCEPSELAAVLTRLAAGSELCARLAEGARAGAAGHDWRAVGPRLWGERLGRALPPTAREAGGITVHRV
jgi:glycosyltransferase involved in cell wall biosynthesis